MHKLMDTGVEHRTRQKHGLISVTKQHIYPNTTPTVNRVCLSVCCAIIVTGTGVKCKEALYVA